MAHIYFFTFENEEGRTTTENICSLSFSDFLIVSLVKISFLKYLISPKILPFLGKIKDNLTFNLFSNLRQIK